MGLIKVLLIIFFIYYAFKFFARLFAPILMKKVVNKMEQKAKEGFQGRNQAPEVREGETIIDKKPAKGQQTNDNVGDYVEFEEID